MHVTTLEHYRRSINILPGEGGKKIPEWISEKNISMTALDVFSSGQEFVNNLLEYVIEPIDKSWNQKTKQIKSVDYNPQASYTAQLVF